jgi:hypothetical protein
VEAVKKEPSPDPANVSASKNKKQRQKQGDAIRTCTSTFSAITRNDLPQDIQLAMKTGINETLVGTSDFCIEFSLKVREMMLQLNTHTLEKTASNDIVLVPKEGFLISTLLPGDYTLEGNQTRVAPSLNQSFTATATATASFKKILNLYSTNHTYRICTLIILVHRVY